MYDEQTCSSLNLLLPTVTSTHLHYYSRTHKVNNVCLLMINKPVPHTAPEIVASYSDKHTFALL